MPPALGALGHQGDPMWGRGSGLSNMLHPISGGGGGGGSWLLGGL